MSATAKPAIRAFFDEPTNTVSYLVWDAATMEGAVIDPVLDYDFRSGKATFASSDAILAEAQKLGVKISQVLETHAHADHLSGAPYIKLKTGATVAIGEHIRDVQRIFRPVFNAIDVSGDGSEFDHLFKDGERFKDRKPRRRGDLHPRPHAGLRLLQDRRRGLRRRHPVHARLRHRARRIFPAATRMRSTVRSSAFCRCRRETRLFMCHDYKAPGRDDYAWETTVGEERARNVHVHEGVSEDAFVAMRTTRDAKLAAPLAAAALDPGQYPRRQVPAGRGQRRALPEGAGETGVVSPARRLRKGSAPSREGGGDRQTAGTYPTRKTPTWRDKLKDPLPQARPNRFRSATTSRSPTK